MATKSAPATFRRVRTQFIAALGDPQATSGAGAKKWGIWRVDPGPRGVSLKNWESLKAARLTAPAGWKLDPNDWWIEEHGLLMESPDFPLPAGKYIVTGGREVTTVLTIHEDGDHWELESGKLHDVTHLPCRSARYTPLNQFASPGDANIRQYPVTPGGMMPDIVSCSKQDYWVVFVTAIQEQGKAEL